MTLFIDKNYVLDSMNFDSSNGSVSEARIKKFIGDHQKCPFFDVSLESGENVQEVFQTGMLIKS